MIQASLPDEAPSTRRRTPSAAATPRERRRFSGAMLASAVFHVALLALLIGLWRSPSEEAAPAIPVELIEGQGASGAAGGGNDVTAGSAQASSSDAANPAPSTEAQAQQADTGTAREAVTAPAESAEAVTLAPPSTEPAALPDEVPPVTAEAAELVPPRKPAPPRSLESASHPQSQPAQSRPQPVAQAQTEPAPTATSSAAQANATPLAAGVGGRGRGDEGAGRAAFGDGSLEGPGDDYLSQLQRWIGRFRKYPDEAIAKKQEGTVKFGFKLARDGTILDAWIEQSSGFPLLDDATLKMIHAASPVPKVPDKYQGETLTLAMPSRFSIGVFDRLFR